MKSGKTWFRRKIYWVFCFSTLLPFSLIPISVTAQNGTLPADSSSTSTARYRITFTSTWSSETHPAADFPTASAHFSPLIGATHDDGVALWAPGALASDGIEEMAETGGTTSLTSELDAAAGDGRVDRVLGGAALSTASGTVALDVVSISQAYPLVSLVTMIAPSPDWFVGVHGVSLLDENGEWLDEVVVELDPYDAGTDSGADYTSINDDADPAEPIRNLRGTTPFADAPLGTLTFERIYVTFLPLATAGEAAR